MAYGEGRGGRSCFKLVDCASGTGGAWRSPAGVKNGEFDLYGLWRGGGGGKFFSSLIMSSGSVTL